MKRSASIWIVICLFCSTGLLGDGSRREPEAHQVILYEHSHYKGSYIVLSYDRTINNIGYWHTNSGKSWNDKISSLKVGKRAKVILYKDKLSHNNGGGHVTIQGDCVYTKKIPRLSKIGWNDKATGIKVRKADCYD